MNVFIIPSWYPTRRSPLSGVFIKEQAVALAEFAPSVRPIVSNWGFDDFFISLKALRHSFENTCWYISQSKPHIRYVDGIWEAFRPTLTLSSRVLGEKGALWLLLRANIENFQLASKRFGLISLIHAHVCFPAGYIAKEIAALYGIPYVLTEHMGPFPLPAAADRSGCPRKEVREALRYAARCIAVSPALRDRIFNLGFARPDVIPNLVNEELFAPRTFSSNKFVFLTVCIVTREKGIDILLRGIALWKPPENVEFHIVGDGPQVRAYQDLARDLGISSFLFWHGEVNRVDIASFYQRCDAFILPSMFESFGVVYAEAIACGKPVIATLCGGPESIVNERNGVLVRVGDVSALAKAMELFYTGIIRFNPEEVRRDFMDRFSREAVVNQLIKLYQEVVPSSSASLGS